MAKNLLSKYHEKRNFDITAEPKGKTEKSKKNLRFVIQLHEATRTHYDFRLEWNGVMKSWAVTRGPSYDPADKRLAVRTEDHPIEYNKFEGVIPDKQYGAGPVMIWDEGIWIPEDEPEKMEKKGHITFTIEGTRMKGQWHLVRMHSKEKRENWLLIKSKDGEALTPKKAGSFLKKENTSIITGRTMTEIRNDGNGNTAQKKRAAKSSSASLPALLKKYGKPELATLVENPPSGSAWVHEIKYDGYRLMAFISNGDVVLRTRGLKDWTHKFAPLAKALSSLNVESAVLDLEACVLNDQGRTDFSMLQTALSEGKPEKIEGFIFDLIYLNGEDQAKTRLTERKSLLKNLLKKSKSPLHYSEHYESAPDLLPKACQIGAEGLVSKRKDSVYQGRRTDDWVKSKCGLEQEFVIGGFMPAKDEEKAVGAVLLGYYKNGKLLYAGKVGTGFTRQTAKDTYKKLIAFKTGKNPFPEKPPRGLRPYVFIDPKILCEVSFAEWTADGHIRHGSFKGLREDKNPKEVKEEKPKSVKLPVSKKKKVDVAFHGVTITHPDREIFPGTSITKADMAAYYDQIAPLMLPFIENRLISLLRCTDGISGQCFFQRNPMRGMGNFIKGKKLNHKGKAHEYLYVEDAVGLIQLVQMGTIEFHGWQSRLDSKNKPDQIIFDLDPAEDVPFEAVKLAAEDIRGRLKKLKLESFARLSGGKGIHVVVPIKPNYEWDKVKEFARKFSENMAREVPEAYVANMSKGKRKGKIFIDFFRNDFSSTAILPFSLRARENAPLAWPVAWADLKKYKTASAFTLESIKAADIKKAEQEVTRFFTASRSEKLPTLKSIINIYNQR
jgi:bifunctional non-homologous end joining protein LigD